MNRPLKILMVLHMPWNRNLGGSRVQLELADELQKMGHQVEKFDCNDALTITNSSISEKIKLFQPKFSSRAKAFVQANGHKFDIIDAHQGNLPFSKQELGIKGLLVARSVGLYAFYHDFAKLEQTKWPPQKIKTKLGNKFRYWQSRKELPHYLSSLQNCDLINVPNHDELAYVRDILALGNKCFVFPFGLSQNRQQAFSEAIQPANLRLANKQVVFIGTWGTRKGSKNWAEIIMRTKAKVPEANFLFLGTGYSAEAILSDMNIPAYDWIKIIPNFNSEELPALLSSATVGAFPSYIEGFGFAVLEKLACGIPTIAYNVPGPREMLRYFDAEFLINSGDTEAFSNQIVKLLNLDEITYAQLSQRCIEVAKLFSWQKIAQNTLDTYAMFLDVQNARKLI